MVERSVLLGLLLAAAVGLSACAASTTGYTPSPALRALQGLPAPRYPAAAFAVFTDPHIYHRRLGVSGAAFQDYLDRDRKLLAESEALMDAAVAAIAALDVDFVLVCGDLTKDGERVNHRLAAEKLQRLRAAGKSVFVIPGNHDIANGEAVRFEGDRSEPVSSVTADEFVRIYQDFGYAAALEQDPASLSYLAEPVPGLWLLALDSCRWQEHRPGGHQITGGAFSAETLGWIETILARARRSGRPVIVMQHHGVLEHYPHNREFYGEYLVNDDETVAGLFAAHGVQLVFTGHFHAQDVTARTFGEPPHTLYDIETGSTVTAPCPYRIVRIGTDQKARIESRFITEIEGHSGDMAAYAEAYVYRGTIKLADTALKTYRVSAADRARLAPQISRAYVTHLKGDEQAPAVMVDTSGLSPWGRFVMWMQADLIEGWYTDLPPADNRLTIDLAAGRQLRGEWRRGAGGMAPSQKASGSALNGSTRRRPSMS